MKENARKFGLAVAIYLGGLGVGAGLLVGLSYAFAQSPVLGALFVVALLAIGLLFIAWYRRDMMTMQGWYITALREMQPQQIQISKPETKRIAPPARWVQDDSGALLDAERLESDCDAILSMRDQGWPAPRQETIERLLGITDHTRISQALDELARRGEVTAAFPGKHARRQWVFPTPNRLLTDSPADSPQADDAGNAAF